MRSCLIICLLLVALAPLPARESVQLQACAHVPLVVRVQGPVTVETAPGRVPTCRVSVQANVPWRLTILTIQGNVVASAVCGEPGIHSDLRVPLLASAPTAVGPNDLVCTLTPL